MCAKSRYSGKSGKSKPTVKAGKPQKSRQRKKARQEKGLPFSCVALIGLVGAGVLPLILVPITVVALYPGAQWRPDMPWGIFVGVGLALLACASVLDVAVIKLLAGIPGNWLVHEIAERGLEMMVTALLFYVLMTPFWAALLTAFILEVIGAVAEPVMNRLEEAAPNL